MSIPVILILVVSGLLLARLRWRRSGWVALALALVMLVGLGCGPFTAVMLDDLQRGYSAQVNVQAARVTAIVVLGNGTEKVGAPGGDAVEVGALAYSRVFKALELYQGCKRVSASCFVLISGGDPQGHGESEAAVYGAQLTRLGVLSSDLVLEDRSLNTFQNAQFTAPLLQARSPDQVFLVSSGLHLRRALLYFAHFGVHPRPARADYVSAIPSVLPLSYNFLGADLALHEYEGLLRYFVYQRMGWNAPAASARSP